MTEKAVMEIKLGTEARGFGGMGSTPVQLSVIGTA